MHRAPAASFTVLRSRWHLRVIFILWGMGCAALLVLLPTQVTPLAWWLAAMVLLALGVLALWRWQQSPVGRLQWDGEYWHWSSHDETYACHPTWVLDFQRVLLLRVHLTPGRNIYIWLERPAPAHLSWNALRRAIAGSQQMQSTHGRKSASQVAEHGL